MSDSGDVAMGDPPEKLDCSKDERFAEFTSYYAGHRLQMRADRQLTRAMARAEKIRRERKGEPNGSIILVYGPSGVGKTCLRLAVERRIVKAEMAKMQEDQSYQPFCSFEPKGPDSSPTFSWLDFFERGLTSLNEPLIHYKIVVVQRDPIDGIGFSLVRGGRALRSSFEKALGYRRTSDVFIDEGHHIGEVAGAARFKLDLETLKSLADTCNVTLILFGTYDLLSFRTLNGQLGRRLFQVHLPRYRRDRADDVAEFKKVLRTFQGRIPLRQVPDFEKDWEYFYTRSCGCIGVLKDWLLRALDEVLEDGRDELTRDDLDASALDADELDTMAADIIDGETQLRDSRSLDRYDLVASKLAQPPKRMLQPVTEHEGHGMPASGQKSRRGQVAQRKPARDPGSHGYRAG